MNTITELEEQEERRRAWRRFRCTILRLQQYSRRAPETDEKANVPFGFLAESLRLAILRDNHPNASLLEEYTIGQTVPQEHPGRSLSFSVEEQVGQQLSSDSLTLESNEGAGNYTTNYSLLETSQSQIIKQTVKRVTESEEKERCRRAWSRFCATRFRLPQYSRRTPETDEKANVPFGFLAESLKHTIIKDKHPNASLLGEYTIGQTVPQEHPGRSLSFSDEEQVEQQLSSDSLTLESNEVAASVPVLLDGERQEGPSLTQWQDSEFDVKARLTNRESPVVNEATEAIRDNHPYGFLLEDTFRETVPQVLPACRRSLSFSDEEEVGRQLSSSDSLESDERAAEVPVLLDDEEQEGFSLNQWRHSESDEEAPTSRRRLPSVDDATWARCRVSTSVAVLERSQIRGLDLDSDEPPRFSAPSRCNFRSDREKLVRACGGSSPDSLTLESGKEAAKVPVRLFDEEQEGLAVIQWREPESDVGAPSTVEMPVVGDATGTEPRVSTDVADSDSDSNGLPEFSAPSWLNFKFDRDELMACFNECLRERVMETFGIQI